MGAVDFYRPVGGKYGYLAGGVWEALFPDSLASSHPQIQVGHHSYKGCAEMGVSRPDGAGGAWKKYLGKDMQI